MSGTPYIVFRGDRERAKQLVRRGQQELMRTRAVQAETGAPVYGRSATIDEYGTTIYTSVNGDIEVIHILAPPLITVEEVKQEIELLEAEGALGFSFFSGFAYNKTALTDSGEPGTMEDFNPTNACRQTFLNTKEEFATDSYEPVRRLALYPNNAVMPQNYPYGPSIDGDAQSDAVRPCMYSGAIAEVASIVLGLGTMDLTAAERLALIPEVKDGWFASSVSSSGFQVTYGWTYERTTGLSLGADGEWYIVEISEMNGIIARRLDETFLEGAFYNDDPEALAFYAKYGGIPSGESFPLNRSDVLNGIDEGWIIEIWDPQRYADEFYTDENSFGPTVNWCFSPDGKEARICSWNEEQHPLFKEGRYWRLKFALNSNSGASGASLTLLSSEFLCNGIKTEGYGSALNTGAWYLYSSYWPDIQRWWDNSSVTTTITNATQMDLYLGDMPSSVKQEVWVGWIDGDWHHIYADHEQYMEESYEPLEAPRTPYIGPVMSKYPDRYYTPRATSSDAHTFDSSWTSRMLEDGWNVLTSYWKYGPTYPGDELRAPHFTGESYAYTYIPYGGRDTQHHHDFMIAPYNRNAYFVKEYKLWYNNQRKNTGVRTHASVADVWEGVSLWGIPVSAGEQPGGSQPVYNVSHPFPTPEYYAGTSNQMYRMNYFKQGNLSRAEDTTSQCACSRVYWEDTYPPPIDWGSPIGDDDNSFHYGWPSLIRTGLWNLGCNEGCYDVTCSAIYGPCMLPGAYTFNLVGSGVTAGFADNTGESLETYYEGEMWLVSSTTGKISVGTMENEDNYYDLASNYNMWCQEAVAGSPGAVFSLWEKDPADEVRGRGYSSYVLKMDTAEAHVALPDTEEDHNHRYRWLTFVGINGA